MSVIRNAASSTGALSPNSAANKDAELLKACQQVEGLFINQLMAAMDRPSFGEGMLGGSGATQLFSSRRNDAIAEEMGARGELGLAKMLYDDLSRQAGAARALARSDENPAQRSESR